MTKFGTLFLGLAATLVVSTKAQATLVPMDLSRLQQAAMSEARMMSGLQWKVGDKASYKVKMGFINGTSNNFVREDLGTELWVVNDMNLGFMGQQKIEILFNKADGQIKKVLANGQEQQLPSADNYELIDMKQDQITVAAGTFQCVYIKVHDKKQNQDQEAWMNPKDVPMAGMIMSKGKSQIGAVVEELTSFSFANP